jgi:hypothetical protein
MGGGLGQRWSIINSWEKGEVEEDSYTNQWDKIYFIFSLLQNVQK